MVIIYNSILRFLLFINKKRLNTSTDGFPETITELTFLCGKRPLEYHILGLMSLKGTGISYKIALRVFRRLYPMNLK